MYEKEDKRAMDLALITAKQVFELFILILCGVVIGKIKMVNEEGKGMLSNLLIYFVVPFMIINSYRRRASWRKEPCRGRFCYRCG